MFCDASKGIPNPLPSQGDFGRSAGKMRSPRCFPISAFKFCFPLSAFRFSAFQLLSSAFLLLISGF
jgi:hypothetical protein